MAQPTLTPDLAVAIWNKEFPIGTKVAVSKDNHAIHFGETKSAAYVLSGHTAVIHITGISGSYALNRVTAMPKE